MSVGEYSISEHSISSDAQQGYINQFNSGNALFLVRFTGFSVAGNVDPSSSVSDAAISEVAVSGGSESGSGKTTHLFSGANYSDGVFVFQHRINGLSVEWRADQIIGKADVFAEIELENVDGSLDGIAIAESVIGAEAEILCGQPYLPLAGFQAIAKLPIAEVSLSDNTLTVRLEADDSDLLKPLSDVTYAGTGGLEGGEDLKGVRKPVAFGKPRNVTPVSVDPSLLLYQVHDGPIDGLDAVFDEGVQLTAGADYTSQTDMLNNTPAPGTYRVWPGGGMFRLGSPPAGAITADVRGDANGGFSSLPGDVVRSMMNRLSIPNSRIAFGDLNTLNTWLPYDSQVFDVSGSSFLDLIKPFTDSGMLLFTDRHGRFRLRRVATSWPPVDFFYEDDIIDISVESIPREYAPVVYRVEASYGHNYTVQTKFAGGASDARKTFAQAQDRSSVIEDANVKAVFPKAQIMQQSTPFLTSTGGDNVAAFLLQFFKQHRNLFRVTLPIRAAFIELFDTVFIQIRRYNLDAGATGLVVGVMITAEDATVELAILI